MAIYTENNEQLIEALNEDIYVIKHCLNFVKKDAGNPEWENDNGCLGIPATILLCSVIDTIGSFFRGSAYKIKIDENNYSINTVDEHFFILNHDKLFNLNLKGITIRDFYSTYRSKLTHNNSLPLNNFLAIGKDESEIFKLNLNNEITEIQLYPLFEEVTKATETFKYYLKNSTFSPENKVSNELLGKAKLDAPSIINYPVVTGNTNPSTGTTNIHI